MASSDADAHLLERVAEAKAALLSVVRSLRAERSGARAAAALTDTKQITTKDLRQLALQWGIVRDAGFWAAYPTLDSLALVIARTARRLREARAEAPHIAGLALDAAVAAAAARGIVGGGGGSTAGSGAAGSRKV